MKECSTVCLPCVLNATQKEQLKKVNLVSGKHTFLFLSRRLRVETSFCRTAVFGLFYKPNFGGAYMKAILHPFLFKPCMNELIKGLENKTANILSGKIVNIVCYADYLDLGY